MDNHRAITFSFTGEIDAAPTALDAYKHIFLAKRGGRRDSKESEQFVFFPDIR
ncbi:MAG: hypothetical protein AB7W44_17945 [Pyrinomonadaceae bacterium]